jgi:hypothetical protein
VDGGAVLNPEAPLAARAAAMAANRRRAALLALSSPLLIALALLGLLHRSGPARWEVLPALLIGAGLLLTSLQRRRHRRWQLLRALRQERALRQGEAQGFGARA